MKSLRILVMLIALFAVVSPAHAGPWWKKYDVFSIVVLPIAGNFAKIFSDWVPIDRNKGFSQNRFPCYSFKIKQDRWKK